MKLYVLPISIVVLILSIISSFVLIDQKIYSSSERIKTIASKEKNVSVQESKTESAIDVKDVPSKFEIPSATHVGQTFNNCGPATLSMAMSYFGVNVGQDELREQMRPFNNPQGGVDDKSIFADEFVYYAQKNGLMAVARPGGDMSLLKKFVANGIPVVVRTWLHPDEDIGHFRIVRGYDDNTSSLIQDDSYEGRGLTYDFEVFDQMWKPFNRGYIVVYPKQKEALVRAILGDANDTKKSYLASIQDNWNMQDGYELFNLSTAYFHLGDYQKSVEYFEKAYSKGLPSRMLWYQIEPIEAYLKLKNYNKVFELTSSILNNGNMAYSELYVVRGMAYLEQGNKEAAKEEFEKAVNYNKNFSSKVPVVN